MRLGPRIPAITAAGSDGWEIHYLARERQAAGERVVNLTIGEPDRRTDPAILEAMHRAALAGHTGYTFGAGLPELRQAIADRVAARTGVPTRAENVIVTPGGQSALFAAHMVLLSEGDTGLYLEPFYPTYSGTIRATGARAHAVATRPEAGFQPEAAPILAAAHATGARSLLINTPNNPTGVIYRPETLAALADACREADLWLISDEVYDTQVWQGRHLSPRALPGMAERTLVIGSMSKSHAMTGSRLGWIVAPQEVVEAVTVLATNTTYGVPAFIQMAALFALGRGPAFEAELAAPFNRRREILAQAVARSQALRMTPADGAMYVMLDIRPTGLSGMEFACGLLASEGIAVMPGESFGAPAAGHLRVALTLPEPELADAAARLVAHAEALIA